MNTLYKIKIIQYLIDKKSNKGFTLIELLVVVMIIGILVALTIPNLLGQVAKARQSEAVNNLGTMNRTQEAYRLENATFSRQLNQLPIKFTWLYYDFTLGAGNVTTLKRGVRYWTQAKTDYENDVLDYGAGIMINPDGVFSAVVCREESLNVNAGYTPDFAQLPTNSPYADCDITRSVQVK